MEHNNKKIFTALEVQRPSILLPKHTLFTISYCLSSVVLSVLLRNGCKIICMKFAPQCSFIITIVVTCIFWLFPNWKTLFWKNVLLSLEEDIFYLLPWKFFLHFTSERNYLKFTQFFREDVDIHIKDLMNHSVINLQLWNFVLVPLI